MRLTAVVTVPPGRTITQWQGMRLLEYKTACRAPIRTCPELYGSATSAGARGSEYHLNPSS